MKRFIRLDSLGRGYEKSDIKERVKDNLMRLDFLRPDWIGYPPDDALGKFIGTQAYYYNITQQMRRLSDE